MKKRLSYCVHLVYVSVHFKFIFIPSTSKQRKYRGFFVIIMFICLMTCMFVFMFYSCHFFLSLNFLVLSVATEIETYVLQNCLVFRPMYIGNSKRWTYKPLGVIAKWQWPESYKCLCLYLHCFLCVLCTLWFKFILLSYASFQCYFIS